MARLRVAAPQWNAPVVTLIANQTSDPFRVLISCLLSLRTKDETTGPASRRLFALASTPHGMLALDARRIEEAIYPVGFYHNKARTILDLCRTLVERSGGKVPDDLDELLTLKGVGRKTANLVLTQGFKKPGICVDTHVHRISNRWGYVRTKDTACHGDGAAAQTARRVLDRVQRFARGLRPNAVRADLAVVQPLSGGRVLRAARCRAPSIEQDSDQ